MTPSLSLASMNVEMSRHLDRVGRFVSQHIVDVFCIQELCESDIERIRTIHVGYSYIYEPMKYEADIGTTVGLGIFCRQSITPSPAVYYRGIPGKVLQYDRADTAARSLTQNHMVLLCDIEKDGATFSVGTTHFTWTPDGKADDIQRNDITILLDKLNGLGELILCGDFNAPRGGEIFELLANRFRDNIPSHYLTSIDPKLHHAGALQVMVDGLFTTPGYEASDVMLHSGVSDHCAITARISPAQSANL